MPAAQRKRHFSRAENRAGRCFSPDLVFTLYFYQHVVNCSTYELDVLYRCAQRFAPPSSKGDTCLGCGKQRGMGRLQSHTDTAMAPSPTPRVAPPPCPILRPIRRRFKLARYIADQPLQLMMRRRSAPGEFLYRFLMHHECLLLRPAGG